MNDYRQEENKYYGFCCYFNEDNPREWSLWRESDDVRLTPWISLGLDGMIWVFWNNADEYILVLEHRDDETAPLVSKQALMHLPSGKMTDFVFAGDNDDSMGIELLNLGNNEVLIITFEHDCKINPNCLGASLYDKNFKELIKSSIWHIRPCGKNNEYVDIAIKYPDMSIGWGVFDYRKAFFVVPAQYDEVFEHFDKWICNYGECSDLRDKDGKIIATYPYNLYDSDSKEGRLFVKKEELWGWADSSGCITVEPYANDTDVLLSEIKKFSKLRLTETAKTPFCLDTITVKHLVESIREFGISIKYEGVRHRGGGDGMLDIGYALMPEDVRALLIEERWGNFRFLIPLNPWRKLPAGVVLILQGTSSVQTVEKSDKEEHFLLDVFAQSIDL